ncbi:MAG: AAA family ATPase [Acidobacteriota bacterium]|nr:AAA family ATPase [Acidobacteriota bacterium]MDE2965375.1 AAA family ATPase [Acidobacteriota bacterium]
MDNQKVNEFRKGNYSLDVSNFGPIVQASVDLRPLTVFVGPSNTGKSYLAILIYALHRCLGGLTLTHKGWFSHRLGWRIDPTELGSAANEKEVRRGLHDWLVKALAAGTEPLPALPSEVASYMRSSLEQVKSLGRNLEKQIERCFGVEKSAELVRRYGSATASQIGFGVPQDDAGRIRYQLEFGKGECRFSGHISDIEPLEIGFPGSLDERNEWLRRFTTLGVTKPQDLQFLLESLTQMLFRSLVDPIYQDAYYLPADRTGVMHSHQVVVSTLIQKAATAGLRRPLDVPMLSGVLADFLEQLVEMSSARVRSRHKTSRELAGYLETNILMGQVRVDRAVTGYPTFTYRPKDWKKDLPLMRASSMVSELAPIVLYLRHVVRSDDLLIIEEPESHLHPAMQTAFARELARAVRNGVRIVMTTHSEWFLEQIGNLVTLSGLPKNNRKGVIDEDFSLRPDELGVWLFEATKRPKGSTVKEVKLDRETGLYPSGFEKVSEVLYNEGAKIFNRMQEGGS